MRGIALLGLVVLFSGCAAPPTTTLDAAVDDCWAVRGYLTADLDMPFQDVDGTPQPGHGWLFPHAARANARLSEFVWQPPNGTASRMVLSWFDPSRNALFDESPALEQPIFVAEYPNGATTKQMRADLDALFARTGQPAEDWILALLASPYYLYPNERIPIYFDQSNRDDGDVYYSAIRLQRTWDGPSPVPLATTLLSKGWTVHQPLENFTGTVEEYRETLDYETGIGPQVVNVYEDGSITGVIVTHRPDDDLEGVARTILAEHGLVVKGLVVDDTAPPYCED